MTSTWSDVVCDVCVVCVVFEIERCLVCYLLLWDTSIVILTSGNVVLFHHLYARCSGEPSIIHICAWLFLVYFKKLLESWPGYISFGLVHMSIKLLNIKNSKTRKRCSALNMLALVLLDLERDILINIIWVIDKIVIRIKK